MPNRKGSFPPPKNFLKFYALGLIILLLGFSLLTAGHFHSGGLLPSGWNQVFKSENHSDCSLCRIGTLLSGLGLAPDFNFLTQELSCGLFAVPDSCGFRTGENARPIRAPPFSA